MEEYGPGGMVPECGAIFMANGETKNECLKMEVFALPSGSANFVKQVKAGMLLFLFEYEKRQLFGVYRATTDGGINILSQGSCYSLTQFPAQVGFTPVWFCDPLSEKEFKDAIKENYYATRKFNFGLSKDQVHKLLQLFSLRKLKNELQPKQLRGSSEPSLDLRHKLNKKLDAENREGRNGSPELLIKDKGHFADRCKEEYNSYQYVVNVTNSTFEQSDLPNNFSGSLSTKRRKEDNDKYPMNLKDQRSVHHYVFGPNFSREYNCDTLDGNKRTKGDADRNFVKVDDQRSVHQDVPGLNFCGEYHGDTLASNKIRNEEDDRYLLNLKDQRSVHHNVFGPNFSREYNGDTLDGNKRTKGNAGRNFVKVDDQRSVHQDVPGLNFCGEYHGDTSASNKRRNEEDDRYLMNLKDQRSAYHDVPGQNFCGEYPGETSESKKRRKEDGDGYPMKLKDQHYVHQDISCIDIYGEYHGDTLDSKTLSNDHRRKEDYDRYLMNLKDQRSVHHDVSGEYNGDTLDTDKRTMEEDDRYLMNLQDQRSAHHDVCGEYNGDTLDTIKTTKEEDDRYLMNLQDQRSVYHDAPTLNFGSEYSGDFFDKHREPSKYDELLLSGKGQYEDKDSTLGVGKYLPVPSNLRVASNDMYTFVDRVVADVELDGRPSNSPHICSATFEFGPKGLSDDKFFMNLGSKRTYELCNSHEDVLLNEITGDAKCSNPEFRYPLNDTKCLTQDMQNMDHIHRPDVYINSASGDEWKYRPHMSSQFKSEHCLGASLEPDYSFGKFDENTVGSQGVTGDGLDLVRDGIMKASHSGEPIWFSELHGNSSQSYIPSRRSFNASRFTKHNQDDDSSVMDSFHNSVASFGYGASCQPNEDPLMYCGGSPLIKKNKFSEAQHLIHTCPSYHESLVTKLIPCDSDVNYSHPAPSSSLRAFSSSSLLRGIPPSHDSREPHVSNSRSLLYHPEGDHLSKFSYKDSKNQDILQCSTSANQDYYLGDANNCFENTEAAVNRELENILPTNRRSPLFATSPSANKRLPEDVVCSEEKLRHHALSSHKNLSVDYFDSIHSSSSHVCEHIQDKSSARQFPNVNWSSAGYTGGKDLAIYDSEHYTSQGEVMGQGNRNGNGNAEHPSDVSDIPKSNRRSVFARLSSGPENSSREKLDSDQLFSADTTVDELMDTLLQHKKPQLKKQGKGKSQKLAKRDEENLDCDQMLKADASVDEVMGMSPQGKTYLVKMPGESRKLAAQPNEEVPKTKKNLPFEGPVEHGHLMTDSSEKDHSKISSAKLANYVNLADGECPDDILRETRVVHFKRRSETKKSFDESIGKRNDKAVDKRTAVEGPMGNKDVDSRTAGGSTKLAPFKRRKLVRPVFVVNELVAEEGMEAKPKMHDPVQSPIKDTPDRKG